MNTIAQEFPACKSPLADGLEENIQGLTWGYWHGLTAAPSLSELNRYADYEPWSASGSRRVDKWRAFALAKPERAALAAGLSTLHIFSRGFDELRSEVRLQGCLVTMKHSKRWVRGRGQAGVGGLRGCITEFSDASRLRLMRFVARFKTDQRPWFVTLTYPGEWPADPEVWKRDLNVFWLRLKRAYPMASCPWKLEPQERGAPHYHLLLFGITRIRAFRRWLAQAWYEVVGSGDEKHFRAGTKAETIRSWRGVMSYTAKYLGKVQEMPEAWRGGVGRFWGAYGRDNLPLAEVEQIDCSDEAVSYLMAEGQAIIRASTGRPEWKERGSLTVFGLAAEWKERAAYAGVSWGSGNERVRGPGGEVRHVSRDELRLLPDEWGLTGRDEWGRENWCQDLEEQYLTINRLADERGAR